MQFPVPASENSEWERHNRHILQAHQHIKSRFHLTGSIIVSESDHLLPIAHNVERQTLSKSGDSYRETVQIQYLVAYLTFFWQK